VLACARFRQIPCAEIADLSQRWNAIDADAELILATPRDEAILLGAFQRSTEVRTGQPLYRRGSGGAAVQLGPGSVWLRLALSRVDALVSCTPEKLINRYVRPLLRALSKCGPPASHFGRDWISADHRPIAMVSFAHEARTGRASFESVIAVTTPFAVA